MQLDRVRRRSGRAAAGARGRPSGGRCPRAGRRASARPPSAPSIGGGENGTRERREPAVRRDLRRTGASRSRARRGRRTRRSSRSARRRARPPTGETAPSPAVTNASASRTGIAGSASAFAGTVEQRERAELEPEDRRGRERRSAIETATASADERAGAGSPRATSRDRGTSVKIATTAANESWKPGSKTRYGFQASSAIAAEEQRVPRRRAAGPPARRATRATPAIPARTTDGCAPTASTYAAIPASAPSSPIQRLTPSSQASTSTPPATRITFWPRDRQQVVEPRRAEVVAQAVGAAPSSSPSTIPSRTARRSPARPGAIARGEPRCAGGRRSRRRLRAGRSASTRRRCRTTCTPWRRSQVRSSNPCVGPARAPHDGEHVEDGALRRRAAERELELNALVDEHAVEAARRGPGARMS